MAAYTMEVMDCRTVEEAVHALHQSSTTWLIANGRKFGDAEARKIARALRSNTTLRELSLAGNQIGPDGAAALGAAIGQHPRLRELYLHKNKLGSRGLERMVVAMQAAGGAPSLQLINLGKNGIGPRFPYGIITQSLRTLNLTNNNLQELPPRMAQSPQLEEVLLDGNPLISPPIELYKRSGWEAAKHFLEATLNAEREDNMRGGFGRVTNDERDEVLLRPARDALYEGRLGESLSLAHHAREQLERMGLSAAHAITKTDELAHKVAVLSVIEGASPPPDSHCELHVNGRVYHASLDAVGKSASLFGLLRVREEGGGGAEDELLGPESGGPAPPPGGGEGGRLQAAIDNTTTLGFKCFLSYLSTDDLELSVRVCTREHADAVRGAAQAASRRACAASSDSDSDSDSDSGSASQRTPAPGPLAFTPPGGSGGGGGAPEVDKLGYPCYLKRDSRRHLVDDELPVTVNIVLEMVGLARRFGCGAMCGAGLEMLWDILRPEHAVRALKAAHLSGERMVKDVCLEFMRECCVHVTRADWALLRDHGGLMLEVMDVLAGRDDDVSSQEEVKTQLLHNVVARLEAAERRLAQEAALREAAEARFEALRTQLVGPGELAQGLAESPECAGPAGRAGARGGKPAWGGPGGCARPGGALGARSVDASG